MPTESIAPKIEASWLNVLKEEFEKPYFANIKKFLISESSARQTIYPPAPLIFNAFNLTPFDQVKVVILGQDPYHGPNQAHGLCFSVQQGIKPPPSLVNIYKELHSDVGMTIPQHGELTSWAQQGVFLLNASLTVRRSEPASHSKIGWLDFTDAVIQKLSDEREGLVFMLWGSFAQNKGALIDSFKHHVLKAPHPSPFSVHRGFYGCKHFSKANELLVQSGREPIDWQIN